MKTYWFVLTLPLFIGLPASAQTVNNNVENITPDNRYTIHSDGTVTDNVTGLMWQQCSLGQTWETNGGEGSCSGTATIHTWDNALIQAADNRDYGYSDWRLPNIKELTSLVAEDRYSPAINSTVFPSPPSSCFLWSGSPFLNNYNNSWAMNCSYGYLSNGSRKNSLNVRLVRSAP